MSTTPASPRNYWIGVVSEDHVRTGVADGYMQLNRGKAGALERMRTGDGLAYYSPRTRYVGGEALQAFTAIGRIRTGRIHQVAVNADFHPFRLDVDYLSCTAASIRPLIDKLSFIRSKAHWGAAFRLGIVRVPEIDFALIARAMGRSFADDFATASADAG